jgi:condensin complex subunit 3
LLLIFNVLRNDTPPMQRLAIEAVFDIMLLFDTRGWRSFGDADAEAHELVRELVPSLQDADDGMRTLAVEGFAKLLYTNRIGEAEVLKQLIVLFFSPTTESDSRLRQCLGVFFPAYRPPQGARMHAHAHAHTHLWKTGCAGSARRVPIGGTVNSSHGRHATFAQVRAAL